MRDYKIIAALADLHIGNRNVSAKDMKKQLKKHFFDVIENLYALDGIFILGDIMHTIVSLNSEYSELFYWFIDKIYKVARKRGATVIIIKGTISHDNDQLNNIKNFCNRDESVDFRIYETVEEITLWDDYKVLVLPDVRVKQLKDIDEKLVPGKYDMILGHGTVGEMQFINQESENAPTKMYVYDTKKLIAASKGPVLFGHVHQYQIINNHFYYVGPFTMLERGWFDAGFVIAGVYNQDRSKFKVEHYVNPDSAAYYDIHVTKRILDTIPIDEIIATIDEMAKEAKDNDLFTLRITRGDESEASDKVLMLESRYRKDRRFSIVKKIKNKHEVEREKEQADRKEKFAYLMDESIELPSILYTYYDTETRPTIPDRKSLAANLTEEHFRQALER